MSIAAAAGKPERSPQTAADWPAAPCVREHRTECHSDALAVEIMLMFFDAVKDRLQSLSILRAAEVEKQQRLLRALAPDALPPAWGTFRVTCDA